MQNWRVDRGEIKDDGIEEVRMMGLKLDLNLD
jgi:hypothetical protein